MHGHTPSLKLTTEQALEQGSPETQSSLLIFRYVLVRVSIAVVKHHEQKQLERIAKELFQFTTFQITVHH